MAVISQKEVEKKIKHVIRLMDYVSEKYLTGTARKKDVEIFYDVYQALAVAWDYYSLMCKHRKGYRQTRNGHSVCRICGKVKGSPDHDLLLPVHGQKVIGKYVPSPGYRKDSFK